MELVSQSVMERVTHRDATHLKTEVKKTIDLDHANSFTGEREGPDEFMVRVERSYIEIIYI